MRTHSKGGSMNTNLLIVSLICLMGLAACSSPGSVSGQPSVQPTSSPEPITPAAPAAETRPPAEQFVAGRLTNINMDAKTFVLKDTKGNAHSFAFSETTKLTRAGGVRSNSHRGWLVMAAGVVRQRITGMRILVIRLLVQRVPAVFKPLQHSGKLLAHVHRCVELHQQGASVSQLKGEGTILLVQWELRKPFCPR